MTNEKKTGKSKEGKSQNSNAATEAVGTISSKNALKEFLEGMRDKLGDESSAPIYAASAINHLLSTPDINGFFDEENKEIARGIWLRLKQSGMQLRNPPMLFGSEEDGVGR